MTPALIPEEGIVAGRMAEGAAAAMGAEVAEAIELKKKPPARDRGRLA